MPLDLNKFSLPAGGGGQRPTDPIKIFESLTQRGEVENLRGPQQAALSEWDEKYRTQSDVLFSLDTGGGKTLVGLLAAQSLVNELRGEVVVACPSIQLVEQFSNQATDCGLKVATYVRSAFTEEDRYRASEIPCVTTYQALFNGRSIFRRQQIVGLVFDDAHVADHVIRDCFTLKLPTSEDAAQALLALFQPYFERTPYKTRFSRLASGTEAWDSQPLFVPTFLTADLSHNIHEVLRHHNVHNNIDTKFAFAHLQDHLDRCITTISRKAIEMTPWLPPSQSLPYFGHNVRRLYMSATLPTRRGFVRTFGVKPTAIVEPTGKTNAAQRLFLFTTDASPEDQRAEALRIAEGRRAAILVPTHNAAARWGDVGTVLPPGSGHATLRAFAEDAHGRLVLVARYDGIDLPGNTCRILIFDGIPQGDCDLSRFLAEGLQIFSERTLLVANRITQGIGRIFRSNRDHGVVIITDSSLRGWLSTPRNHALLPPLLQQQIQMGLEIARRAGEDNVDVKEFAEKIIDGSKDWDAFYQRELDKFPPIGSPDEEDKWVAFAATEAEATVRLWDGRFHEARTLLQMLRDNIPTTDEPLWACLTHLHGLACHLDEQMRSQAAELYRAAARTRAALGTPPITDLANFPVGEMVQPGTQARNASARLSTNWQDNLARLRTLLEGDGGQNAEEHERALHELGDLLGLRASRPENDAGQGPDILWLDPEGETGAFFEAKTQKAVSSSYRKNEDIGQAVSASQWAVREHAGVRIWPTIIGPTIPVSAQASPPPGLRIIEKEQMTSLLGNLESALLLAEQRPVTVPRDRAVQWAFQQKGLLWPKCYESLPSALAEDLQKAQ